MMSQQVIIGLLVTVTIYDSLIRWQLSRRIGRLESIIATLDRDTK